MKTSSALHEVNYMALSCFAKEGEDIDAVVERIQQQFRGAIYDGLSHFSGIGDLLNLLSATGKDIALNLLRTGKQSVVKINSSIFEEFACPLNLCKAAVFGKPSIAKEKEGEILKQLEKEHFVMGDKMGEKEPAVETKPLDIYVYHAAVEELDKYLSNSN